MRRIDGMLQTRHVGSSIYGDEILIFNDKGHIPLEKANEVLQKNRPLVAIGFDVLQVPRYHIMSEYTAEGWKQVTSIFLQ